MQITVADTAYTTEDALPTHPRVLAYWVQYFADRIGLMVDDPAVNDAALRNWLNEIVVDLASLATVDGQLDAVNRLRAQKLAQAMQALTFHDGPDPDEDPALQAQCAPDWTGVLPDAATDQPDAPNQDYGTGIRMLHTGVIIIPTGAAHDFQSMIDERDTRQVGEVLATWSHTFADQYEVDVRVLGSQDGMCTEAVLFRAGSEVAYSDLSETLCDTYALTTPQGDVFRVHVITGDEARASRRSD